MRNDPNPTMPPPCLLDALRQQRRPQLGDPCIKVLLARWKRLGRPIEYADLNRVAEVLGVAQPDAKTRRKIVAAVEAASIEIYDLRKGLAESFAHVQLTGDGMLAIIEQARWCEPEEWDSRRQERDSRPRVCRPKWMTEWDLDQEYGPTLEGWQQKRRGGVLQFLASR